MKKWNLIIDVEKCEDCNNCFLACKDEFVDNAFAGYSAPQPKHGHRWVNIHRKERGQFPIVDVAYLPIPCMHCENAPCIRNAKKGSIYKRDDGIVLIDPELAKGEKDIVDACPYHAIWWNEELELPQKCTFCAHLLDEGWKEPRCVQACPTGAMHVLYAEDSRRDSMIESENLSVLYPEYHTRPRVYYKNTYRFFKCFIGGSVAFERDGRTDCAQGASVALFEKSEKIDEVFTDNFGDFRFDALEEGSGIYQIEIMLEGFEKETYEVDLDKSQYMGVILLKTNKEN